MPRFVILLHETPAGYSRPTHFDLMLEFGDSLKTWALEELPVLDKAVTAERLPDHRPVYLEFEGGVAGGRGCVTRVDSGEFEVLEESAERIVVQLSGQLKGKLALTCEENQRCRAELSAD